jgi:hypothetical protein
LHNPVFRVSRIFHNPTFCVSQIFHNPAKISRLWVAASVTPADPSYPIYLLT